MRVTSVKYEPLAKVFRLGKHKQLRTQRYCCLGPGDNVTSQNETTYAVCINGTAQVLPIYSANDFLYLGTKKIPVVIKEIETEEELSGYHQLEQHHYRGKALHGRRVPLVVKSTDPLLPLILGYVELATTFMMNRPRAAILNTTFQAEEGGISWEEWKKKSVSKYTNLVVRIARTVVSPEFRGLGLATTLVNHAINFAQNHWHISGMKPLFIEITADMLRYVPFVHSSGMHYIGETEGNLQRLQKDMDYILKNFDRVKKREILKEESAGIVDLQVFYATCLKKIEEEQGIERKDLLDLLLHSPHKLSEENWSLLHRIFRTPKPTYLKGLTPYTEKFLLKRLKALQIKEPKDSGDSSIPEKPKTAIELRNCSLSLKGSLARTRSTRKVQQAFGVNREMLETKLFSDLSFKIKTGDVVLICGPSGAGKTTLLSLLTQKLIDPTSAKDGLSGDLIVPGKLKVSTLGPLNNSRPLINALGKTSFEEALSALNVAGLAEAHLYVKKYRELSNGQRYRAMVAKLIASKSDIWIADEFCATLDPITANIVSRKLRNCARKSGITTILAAANWSEFIHELKPDMVIHLRSPWDFKIFEWEDFKNALSTSFFQAKRLTLDKASRPT